MTENAMTPERRAWNFTADTLRDGSPIPPIGEWLAHDGPVVICKSGLHASERLLDALQYTPGLTLHRVTCADVVDEQDDKLVCRRRRIDASRDVPMRAVVRLAIESACLAAWCAGLYLPELLVALDAADRGDWAAAGDAAGAAGDAAWAAQAAIWAAGAARAAGAAGDAARAAWAAQAAIWAARAAGAAGDAARAAGAAAWAARAAGAAGDAARAALEARAIALLWGSDEP